MKSILFILFNVFISGILTSCRSAPDTVAEQLVERAEQCMDTQPDSALQLLESISEPQDLKGELLARYYLLLTQARDNNNMDLSADSSIVYSVDYYKKDEDRARYGKSMYYYGRVVQMLNDDLRAIQIYLNAQSALEDVGEYKMLGLLSENIAVLNKNYSSYSEAIHCLHEAIKYYRQAHDTLSIAYAYQSMGNIFFQNEQMDSVHLCIDKSLSVLKVNPIRLTIEADKLSGLIYSYQKKFKQAEALLLKVVQEEPDEIRKTGHYMALGHLYQLMGNRKKAEKCLEVCLKDSDLLIRAKAYYYLAELTETESDLRQAVKFRNKSDSLLDLADKNKERGKITHLQIQHIKEKFRKEDLQEELEQGVMFAVGLLIITFLLIILYYQYKKYYRTKKHCDSSLERLEQEINKNVLSQEKNKELRIQSAENRLQYECEIEELKEMVSALNTGSDTVPSENQSNIALLRQKLAPGGIKSREEIAAIIKMLDDPNKDVDEVFEQIDVITLVRVLKQGRIVEEKITSKKWAQIYYLVNGLYDDILKRLRGSCPRLTSLDMKLISLILLGFSTNELIFVFEYKASHVLSKAKTRLKSRLGLKKEEDLETFLFQCKNK